MGRAIALVLVAVLTALLVYALVAPRLLTSQPEARPASVASSEIARRDLPALPPSSVPTDSPDSENPSAPIEAPRTMEQRERDRIEEQRGPFYARIRREFGDLLEAFQPADDDPSILSLYPNTENPQIIDVLFYRLVSPDAYRYGFRKARLYLPNTSGRGERFHLVAEATSDSTGGWHLYYK